MIEYLCEHLIPLLEKCFVILMIIVVIKALCGG